MNLKLLGLILLSISLQACSGYEQEEEQGTKLNKMEHSNNECPRGISGLWTDGSQYWEFYLEEERRGKYIAHEGDDTLVFPVDGNVHKGKKDGVSYSLQAYCLNGVLHRKLRTTIGYVDYTYSYDGLSLITTENGMYDSKPFNIRKSFDRN